MAAFFSEHAVFTGCAFSFALCLVSSGNPNGVFSRFPADDVNCFSIGASNGIFLVVKPVSSLILASVSSVPSQPIKTKPVTLSSFCRFRYVLLTLPVFRYRNTRSLYFCYELLQANVVSSQPIADPRNQQGHQMLRFVFGKITDFDHYMPIF